MKYYIPKELYDLFDVAIIWENIWEIEFYTLNPNYKKIWDKLKVTSDYEHIKLIDSEYDKNYQCYTISVFCPELIIYLKECNNYQNKKSESVWKANAISYGWSEQEVLYGYSKYMEGYIHYFKRNINDIVFEKIILME